VKQIGIVPKFSKTPGKIWKGVPKLGEDTKEVLKRLVGLSEEKLKQLKEKGVIDY
jgi:crotonobetainyl-CoA:carnitine CoA-transferase CaiB-like acyl-CoA transferase